jgi:hypothetical protein
MFSGQKLSVVCQHRWKLKWIETSIFGSFECNHVSGVIRELNDSIPPIKHPDISVPVLSDLGVTKCVDVNHVFPVIQELELILAFCPSKCNNMVKFKTKLLCNLMLSEITMLLLKASVEPSLISWNKPSISLYVVAEVVEAR